LSGDDKPTRARSLASLPAWPAGLAGLAGPAGLDGLEDAVTRQNATILYVGQVLRVGRREGLLSAQDARARASEKCPASPRGSLALYKSKRGRWKERKLRRRRRLHFWIFSPQLSGVTLHRERADSRRDFTFVSLFILSLSFPLGDVRDNWNTRGTRFQNLDAD